MANTLALRFMASTCREGDNQVDGKRRIDEHGGGAERRDSYGPNEV